MAKKDKEAEGLVRAKPDEVDELTSKLIADINREFGMRVAYNLAETEAPTVVKRWIDTGSIQLNYAIRNAAGGGYPEGRVVEITGLPSIGKSHLAYHAASVTQKLGGIVIYIDTENATPIAKLAQMGINIARRFVYMDMHATEHVFKAIEDTVIKAKSLSKDIPILVIWDSVAATSPLAELNGEYEDNTVGLQARVISKGMRKITGVIGQHRVTLLCLNQLREAIGVTHGDNLISPGGKAIPYHASIRLRLTSGTQVKDKAGNVIGIHVIATFKKNKVAPPFRKYEFDIIFGKGIVEDEYIFDEVRSYCAENKVIADFEHIKNGKRRVNLSVEGTGAWKSFTITDEETGEVYVEKKFYKPGFGDVLRSEEHGAYIMKIVDAAYTLQAGSTVADEAPSEGESPHTDEE